MKEKERSSKRTRRGIIKRRRVEHINYTLPGGIIIINAEKMTSFRLNTIIRERRNSSEMKREEDEPSDEQAPRRSRGRRRE
jgi:hypothetical protein